MKKDYLHYEKTEISGCGFGIHQLLVKPLLVNCVQVIITVPIQMAMGFL